MEPARDPHRRPATRPRTQATSGRWPDMKVWNFSDQDDREKAACIQARIGVPRAYLSPERLQAALQKFDPSKPVWRTNRRLRPLGSKAKFCTVWKRLLGF